MRHPSLPIVAHVSLCLSSELYPRGRELLTVKTKQPSQSNLHGSPGHKTPRFPPFLQVFTDQAKIALRHIRSECKQSRANDETAEHNEDETSW